MPQARNPTPPKFALGTRLLIIWSGGGWGTLLIPALRRQRQADLCEFRGQPDLQSEFQDRFQSYTEKPCLAMCVRVYKTYVFVIRLGSHSRKSHGYANVHKIKMKHC